MSSLILPKQRIWTPDYGDWPARSYPPGVRPGRQPCPCCCGNKCDGCLAGTVVDQLQVTIAGVIDTGYGTCNLAVNTTAVLDFQQAYTYYPPNGPTQTACVWYLDDYAGVTDHYWWAFVYGFGAVWVLEVWLIEDIDFGDWPPFMPGPTPGDIRGAVYVLDLGVDQPDCSAWTNENVPYIQSGGFWCDWSASTCAVTSVVP